MPAALSPKRVDRDRIYYTRATWENLWPADEVLCFSDPALQQDKRLSGAWYIHPEHDVIAAIADIVKEIGEDRSIPRDRIIIYGSSLGGFGALMVAAHIAGARAFAEVPQLNFKLWLPSAVRDVENYILDMPIKKFRLIHPERVSVLHRFRFAGRIPQFTILTNGTDFRIAEQRNFMKWARQSSLPKDGMNLLIENDVTAGHRVLDKESIAKFVAI